MAGDTRDSIPVPPRPESTPKKTFDTFTPPPSANALPEGAGRNTAGQHAAAPKLSEAVKTVRLEDFKQVHMYPCVRESLLLGIGGAFGVGGVRMILGGMCCTTLLVGRGVSFGGRRILRRCL